MHATIPSHLYLLYHTFTTRLALIISRNVSPQRPNQCPALKNGVVYNPFSTVFRRYRCQQCHNYDMCQTCFWSGGTTHGHDHTKHYVEEYCIVVSGAWGNGCIEVWIRSGSMEIRSGDLGMWGCRRCVHGMCERCRWLQWGMKIWNHEVIEN